jgi:hypothetical protein
LRVFMEKIGYANARYRNFRLKSATTPGEDALNLIHTKVLLLQMFMVYRYSGTMNTASRLSC